MHFGQVKGDGLTRSHCKECHGNYFKDDFKKRQMHDRIKDKYCEDNGYILLRIPNINITINIKKELGFLIFLLISLVFKSFFIIYIAFLKLYFIITHILILNYKFENTLKNLSFSKADMGNLVD